MVCADTGGDQSNVSQILQKAVYIEKSVIYNKNSNDIRRPAISQVQMKKSVHVTSHQCLKLLDHISSQQSSTCKSTCISHWICFVVFNKFFYSPDISNTNSKTFLQQI